MPTPALRHVALVTLFRTPLVGSQSPDKSPNSGLHFLQAISPPAGFREGSLVGKKAVSLNRKTLNSYGVNIIDSFFATNIFV